MAWESLISSCGEVGHWATVPPLNFIHGVVSELRAKPKNLIGRSRLRITIFLSFLVIEMIASFASHTSISSGQLSVKNVLRFFLKVVIDQAPINISLRTSFVVFLPLRIPQQ